MPKKFPFFLFSARGGSAFGGNFSRLTSVGQAFLIFFIICGCATIYNPATQKNEFIIINTATEAALGRAVSVQVELQYPLSRDKEKLQRLNLIGARVADASDRKDLKYYFKVVNNKELNAFALPGGFIYAHSGLMDKATDDELACVVAHEIGHIAARHAVKKMQISLGYQLIMGIAFSKASSIDLMRATDTAFNIIALGYSRQDEKLADKLAVKYAKKSGFDPYGMVTFFEKLKEEEKEKGLNYHIAFLQSHPAIDERIKNVKEEIKIMEGKDVPVIPEPAQER